MSRVAAIDPRFQSYNIEMVEVTGGRFWKPYAVAARPGAKPERFAARTPIDLHDGRLRKLAAALAPAYLRVSGTWANSTFFADSGAPPAAPPAGFNGCADATAVAGRDRLFARRRRSHRHVLCDQRRHAWR
ncbi:expansin (peptidoglycan-binding protein) [Bradyrhizobium sp. USDA 4341]